MEKTVTQLIVQFKNYQAGYDYPLTFDQCCEVLACEEHDAFMFDYGLYRDIWDFRDHLELESQYTGVKRVDTTAHGSAYNYMAKLGIGIACILVTFNHYREISL